MNKFQENKKEYLIAAAYLQIAQSIIADIDISFCDLHEDQEPLSKELIAENMEKAFLYFNKANERSLLEDSTESEILKITKDHVFSYINSVTPESYYAVNECKDIQMTSLMNDLNEMIAYSKNMMDKLDSKNPTHALHEISLYRFRAEKASLELLTGFFDPNTEEAYRELNSKIFGSIRRAIDLADEGVSNDIYKKYVFNELQFLDSKILQPNIKTTTENYFDHIRMLFSSFGDVMKLYYLFFQEVHSRESKSIERIQKIKNFEESCLIRVLINRANFSLLICGEPKIDLELYSGAGIKEKILKLN